MPREAPVMRAMRKARGTGIEATLVRRPCESRDPYAVAVMRGEGALVYLLRPTKTGGYGSLRPVRNCALGQGRHRVGCLSSLPPTTTTDGAAARPGSGR